jgi:hypothetical protein
MTGLAVVLVMVVVVMVVLVVVVFMVTMVEVVIMIMFVVVEVAMVLFVMVIFVCGGCDCDCCGNYADCGGGCGGGSRLTAPLSTLPSHVPSSRKRYVRARLAVSHGLLVRHARGYGTPLFPYNINFPPSSQKSTL